MDRAFEIARRVEAERFRRRRAALVPQLQALLPDSISVTLLDRDQAQACKEAWSASRARRGRAPSQWFFGQATGPDDGTSTITAGFATIARTISPHQVWLWLGGLEPQCVEASSEDVLLHWYQLAALGDYDLGWHDGAEASGVWLTRHSHQWKNAVAYTWDMEAWNDPWEAAAERVFGQG